MKRFLAVVLSSCLVLGMAVSSFAVDVSISAGIKRLLDMGPLGVIPVSSQSEEFISMWRGLMHELVERPSDRMVLVVAQDNSGANWKPGYSIEFYIVSHDLETVRVTNTQSRHVLESVSGYGAVIRYDIGNNSWSVRSASSFHASTSGYFGINVSPSDSSYLPQSLYLANEYKGILPSNLRFVSNVDSITIVDDLEPDEPDPPNPPDPPPITPPDISEPPPIQPPEIKPPPPMNAPPIVAPPSMPGPVIPPSDSKYVPYDTSIFQRLLDYIRQAIGSSSNIGFLIFGSLFGLGMIVKIIRIFVRGK